MSRAALVRSLVLVAWALLTGCAAASEGEPAVVRASRDSERGGLFHDFLDGKLDGAGHPIGATVWQAESECTPTTGTSEADGRTATPLDHDRGALCRVTSASIGAGRFVVNARIAPLDDVLAGCDDSFCTDPVAFEIVARDGMGSELARERFTRARLGEARVLRNVSLTFTHATAGAVDLAIEWPGEVAVRLDYVELFRAERHLVVAPRSSALAPETELSIEMLDPPDGASLALRCGDVDRTDALTAMLDDGRATRERTSFREIVRAPLASVLDGCAMPARLMVSMSSAGWTRATSRVTFRDGEPACTFADDGRTRVLLTGFEPFPADSTSDNSSEQAVLSFDETSVEHVEVARLVLPVEWDTAADLLTRTIDRCRPDVVIGFGQGRWAVDVETTAYNTKDTAEIAGGIPDNRGVVLGGEPIVADGPAELTTRLPADAIVDALAREGISAATSRDPGRYICNNLFYRLMHHVSETDAIAGFVHLPRLPRVDDAERARLRTIVTTVVSHAVAATVPTH